MGSRKQLVLASLVSLMMAGAFVIGIMPMHGALRASAASSASGRIDMVDLLNAVLNLQAGEATAINVSFPVEIEGDEFIVPDTTAQVFINFQAADEPVGSASPVAYAINADNTSGDAFVLHLDTELPVGVGVAFGFGPPYNGVLDVASLLLEPVTTTLSAYAFANAALDEADQTLLIYSVCSEPTDFRVTKVAQDDVDPDKNGLPAPLTDVILPGQQWRASYLQFLTELDAFGYRNVAIANLEQPEKLPYGLGITVSPETGVFVTSPTLQQLQTANLMYPEEEGFLIVTSLASALQLAISEVYGVGNTEGEIAAWAAGVEAIQPPNGRVGWTLPEGGDRLSPYVEIALLAVNTADDTYREVKTLTDAFPVVLEMQNLDVDGEMPVQMWSYLSWIKNAEGTEPAAFDYVFTSVMANLDAAAPIYKWDFVDQQIPALIDPAQPQLGGRLIANLTSLSIFGAFESAMSIYRIDPDSASTCVTPENAENVNIVGTFGNDVVAGTSADDLKDLLKVFFGDVPATIVSAAEVYGEGLVTFAVAPPESDVPQTVDVSVVEVDNDANLALLAQAFKYFDIFTLELVQADGGTISATPVQDTYLAGDVVNLVATVAENYAFVKWLGDVGDIADGDPAGITDATTTLTFDRDPTDTCDDLNVEITAQFQYQPPIIPVEEFFLTVNVVPAGAGTVKVDDELVVLGVPLDSFAPDQEVSLSASPEPPCYAFANWTGTAVDGGLVAVPSSAETTLTFSGTTANLTLIANFVPTCYILTVIRDPEVGGTVTIDPVQEEYLATESVTLEAFPNTTITPAYHFVQWVINEQEITKDNPLTLNFSDFTVRDISVRAVFRQNPVLTILETEGGSVEFLPSELCTATPPEQCVVSTEMVNGNRVVEYPPLTLVTLTAVPASDEFKFIEWQVDCGSTSVPPDCDTRDSDLFAPTITFMITENISVRAIFTAAVFEVTAITPDHSWLFGGVVAAITGTGFMPESTQLLVAGTPVTPLAIETDPPRIWFVVPPLPAAPISQNLVVGVTVRNPPFTAAFSRTVLGGFRYDRYATEDPITTTAFQFTGTTVSMAVALNSDLSLASLELPAPEQNISQAYGLVQATKTASSIDADQIVEGTAVNSAWNFAIHLYNTQVLNVGLNTGAAVHSEITAWTYERAEATAPARLAFTVADTALTAASIRNDVMTWSVDTRYDYGQDITTLVTPVNTDYQSTLEQLEVLPNVGPDTPDGATLITSVGNPAAAPASILGARLYDLTAFSLRTGVQTLPANIVDAMSVDAPGGTVSGPTSGGTQFTILAPLGGLAWVTVGFAADITPTTPASATQIGTVIDNGATEFSAVVQSPQWPTDEETTVDVAVYLNSNLDEPLMIFENAFHFTQVGGEEFPCELLLLLLGLLAALIGLAAGGDSGDGGGPCFIATAAYGTPMAADIDTLRALRDTYLLESSVGTAFVDAYYRVSPAIAVVVAQSPVLAAGVRLLLLPVIFASKCLLSMPAVSLLALGVAMTLARIRRRGKAKA
ncbi:MAG: hypothetical protein NTZ09_09275 [Candidatus Hydrogenedentes bacterium]|nr:hypothetical protein [Candidatus Hydrogenedentota bacterium]